MMDTKTFESLFKGPVCNPQFTMDASASRPRSVTAPALWRKYARLIYPFSTEMVAQDGKSGTETK